MASTYGCVVFGNPMQDWGDFWAQLYLSHLHRLGHIKLDGFISHTSPARERAEVASGFFNKLGLDVRIGRGQDTRSEIADRNSVHPFKEVPFLAEGGEMSPTRNVMGRALRRVQRAYHQQGSKLTVVLQSKLSEFAAYLMRNRGREGLLFKDGECMIGEVIVVSNVSRLADGTPKLVDSSGADKYGEPAFVLPHPTVANNIDDECRDAEYRTQQLFSILQSMGVNITIITDLAAKQAKFPVYMYEDLKSADHIIGNWLAETYPNSLAKVFEECFLPTHSSERRLLTRGQSIEDFFSPVFLNGHGKDLKPGDDYRDLYRTYGSFAPYSAMAAMTLDPACRDLFKFRSIQGPGGQVRIAEAYAVRDRSEFQKKLFNGAMHALEESRSVHHA